MATETATGSIVITGAGSGIGRATTRAFLREGWRVGLIGRQRATLEETAAGHARAMILPCDVTVPDEVERGFAAALDAWGRLDVLFNNAGAGLPTTLIDDIAVDDWNRILSVNVTGMFLCARAAFGAMRRQTPMGGRIINNGSISAHAPRPGSVPYTVTKHAVTGLTKTLSLDGRPFDIACGQIDIGNALTDMAAAMLDGVPQADGRIAAEPVMDVDAVARSVLYMAGMPQGTNVPFLTVMATNMPFVGRG